ncbi:signal peptide peptidase-domain-containing protein [Gautieria morchelliformis]|nr:signal peptide peptidase-domain-containing protein [Gautieria morchelliformis]
MEDIFAYAGLLSLATTVVYAGAWGSLPPPRKDAASQVADEEDEDDEQDLDERLSSSDAYLFPVLASAALLGLYLVFKYLGKEWVNWLLGWYFAVIGVGTVWKTSAALLRMILGKERWRSFDKTRLFLVKNKRELFSLSCRTPIPFLLPFAVLPSAVYMLSNHSSKPALITNILGLSFAYDALCLLKLDGFQTGTTLLAGLCLYDIWWVFGTEVMVEVATTLDAPVKILWPKSSDFSTAKGFTMLGLGDIVIPGAFVSLALRRDLFMSKERDPYRTFAKPYFTAAIVSYVLGLLCTMFVMHTWKAAQPALLYLSPACASSLIFTGLRRGELKQVWQWKDEPAQEKNIDQDLKVLEPVKQEEMQGPPPQRTDIPVVDGSPTGSELVAEDGELEEADDVSDQPPKKRRSTRKRG